MPVSANILIISERPAPTVIDRLSDEGFSLFPSSFSDLQSVRQSQPSCDLAIVVAPESGLADKNDLLDAFKAENIPVLIIGVNHRPADLHSVPSNFCNLELKRRIGSLIRLEIMKQEYKRRSHTTSLYGFTEDDFNEVSPEEQKSSILLVGNQSALLGDILLHLDRSCNVRVCPSPDNAVEELRAGSFDAVIMLGAGQGDVHFRLCTDLRTDSRLFNLPALFVLENENNREAAYIHGASDIIMHPAEMKNLYTRTSLHIQQSDYRFSLQKLFKASKPLPVTDGLTGLYSRGFLQAHIEQLIKDHQSQGKCLCIASITVNNLTKINEEHGYPAGDQILRQIGSIVSFMVRGEDFCGRYKGNQFIIALPSTNKEDAYIALKRVYGVTRNTEFSVAAISEPVSAIIDLGLEEMQDGDTFSDVVKRSKIKGFSKS